MSKEQEAGQGLAFPEGFLWGAATSGHQVEGGNVASDYWMREWTPNSGFADFSGDTCDHYHRYPEDIGLMGSWGLNAYRFSVEWSRVEPERGFFSRAALDHYRRMAETCHAHGIQPVLTLSHWSVPRWFYQQGTWLSSDAAERFGEFAERVTEHLGDLTSWVCTLNEPNLRHLVDTTSVAPTRPVAAEAKLATMAAMHHSAKKAVKAVRGDINVGWTLALVDLWPAEGSEETCEQLRRASQLDWLEVSREDDFVGVQTYSREFIGPEGFVRRELDPSQTMDFGWELYPRGLEHTIRLSAEHSGVPVVVTESGCSTLDDTVRLAYTHEALAGVASCLADGIDVRGYLYWSLFDNYEWEGGYFTHFGLIEVDRTDFRRAVRPTAEWLGRVARANRLLDVP